MESGFRRPIVILVVPVISTAGWGAEKSALDQIPKMGRIWIGQPPGPVPDNPDDSYFRRLRHLVGTNRAGMKGPPGP